MSRLRFINLLTAVWALVAVPALCTGGILMHPCECEPASPCHDSHHEEEEKDSGCGHESSCSIDPCKFVGLRSNEQQDENQIVNVMHLAIAPVPETFEVFCVSIAQLGPPGPFNTPPPSIDFLSSTILLI